MRCSNVNQAKNASFGSDDAQITPFWQHDDQGEKIPDTATASRTANQHIMLPVHARSFSRNRMCKNFKVLNCFRNR
jgi:hypothetical protein